MNLSAATLCCSLHFPRLLLYLLSPLSLYSSDNLTTKALGGTPFLSRLALSVRCARSRVGVTGSPNFSFSKPAIKSDDFLPALAPSLTPTTRMLLRCDRASRSSLLHLSFSISFSISFSLVPMLVTVSD